MSLKRKRSAEDEEGHKSKKRTILDILPKVSWPNLKLGEVLGTGSYDKTCKATLTRYGRPQQTVAVKTLHVSKRKDLEWEAYVLWDLNGTGGCPRLVGVTEDKPTAIVMEFVPGVNLRRYAQTCTRLQFENVMRKAQNAVSQLHKAGYAHEDLHFQNIMVSTQCGKSVHIIDFGRAERLYSCADYRTRGDIRSLEDVRARVLLKYVKKPKKRNIRRK